MSSNNVGEFIEGAKVAILATDVMLPILFMSGEAMELSIPFIEGWAVTFGNVRVFTNDTPHLEKV